MSDTPQTINGELLRLKRESHGWLVSDLATRACMSTKQIRQLEEGGSSSFYSESVKLTSAKKVGSILGLSPAEVFGFASPAPTDESVDDLSNDPADVSGDKTLLAEPTQSSEITQSVRELPPKSPEPTATQATTSPAVDASSAALQATPGASASTVAATEEKNKTPIGAIAALFVAALAVAWWMRPESEPVAVEPPPPIQTLPAETAEAAASASSEAQVPLDAASVAASAASAAVSRPAQAASATASAPAVVRPAVPPNAAPASAPAPGGASASATKPL